MKLLNTHNLQLEEFGDDEVPEYAILSHRWGREEILFDDVKAGPASIPRRRKGFEKVDRSCALAKGQGFKHIWIDTCCIDKSSSAELSEAINSMFAFYECSAVCYAYLSDVVAGDEAHPLERSRWFTRGWTLQELIAPSRVEFYDQKWRPLGDRISLVDQLVGVTKVDRRILERSQQRRCWLHNNHMMPTCSACTRASVVRRLLSTVSVAARMSWASQRITSRQEDVAYSLLGIFDVNMPLLYGEGANAFRRLQEEIVGRSSDQSILGHGPVEGSDLYEYPFFADSPRYFAECSRVLPAPPSFNTALKMAVTPDGLKVDLLCPTSPTIHNSRGGPPLRDGCIFALLNCSLAGSSLSRLGILLAPASAESEGAPRMFYRRVVPPFRIDPTPGSDVVKCTVYAPNEAHGYDVDYEVTFETGDCRVQRLLLRDGSYAGLSMSPELRLSDATNLGSYLIKGSSPPMEDNCFRSKPEGVMNGNGIWVNNQVARIWGMLWVGSQEGDDFYILWGVMDGHSLADIEERPWCHIVDGRNMPSGASRGVEAATARPAVSLDSFTTRFIKASERARSTRPTGVVVDASVGTVEFLGRKRFELTIDIQRARGEQ